MAEEIKKILTVETGRSFDNIKQLRAEISQLNRVVETGTKLIADENGELQEVKVTSQEYDTAVKQLAEDKRTLADVTNLNRNAWNTEADAVDRSQKSYQQLQAEMRRLRVEWRNTASADDRKKIGAEIKDITDRLKEMDAETGFYQRNVGDYFNAIQKGLAGIPGPANKASGAINTVVSSLKQVAATPATAALAALALAVLGASKVFKDFDERLKNNEDLQLQYMETTERARAIMDAYVATLDSMGGKYAELRSNIDETKTKVEVFWKSFILHMEEASDTGKWLPILGLFKQIKAAWGDVKDAASDDNEFLDKEHAITEAYKNYLATYRDSIKKQAEIEKTIAELNLISANPENDPGQRLAAVNASLQKTDELFNEQERVFKARKAHLEAQAATGKNSIEVNNQLAETEAELIRLGSQREMQQRRLIKLRATLNKQIGTFIEGLEDAKEIEAYDAEMTQQAADMMNEVTAGRVEAEDELTAAIVQGAKERMGDLDLELWKEKKALEDEKKIAAAKKQLTQNFGTTVANVFDAIADILEGNSEADEKSVRQAKALRIAAASIDTIQGAVAAYSAAQSISPPYGQIIGAANAALVTTMGLINIAKIKATQVSRNAGGSTGGGGTPIVSAPPAVVQEVPVTRTLTGASEEAQVNTQAETKVVLVMSELEAKQGEIAAKQVETTF